MNVDVAAPAAPPRRISAPAPVLRVVAPGLFSTIQDLGRVGYQRFGVPVSGALDPVSLRTANIIVGNPDATAALEMCRNGVTLDVAATRARVALAGAPCDLRIDGVRVRRQDLLRSRLLRRGQTLEIRRIAGGACYLAVEGGFALPQQLGSLSTYTRARLGGFVGRRLAAGDDLPLRLDAAPERADWMLPEPIAAERDRPIRVVLGPQDDHFTTDAIDTLLGSAFLVSKDADRMGYRLEGPPLRHAGAADIVSDGLTAGCIQVPGSGRPIVMLADRQTTGGYAKIATVISADLHRFGQMLPGATVRFEAVAVEQAEYLRRRQEDAIKALRTALVELP